MATGAAFCAGCPTPVANFPWTLPLHTLLGTVLVSSGAGTLNQLIERNFDAQMRRTARRPIAAGRVGVVQALAFGSLLSVAGLYLALTVPIAASLLALLTFGWYLFLYTPLKRQTRLFRMAALRDSFPLAILAFHGDCVDVSRGLREGRIPGTSAGARKIQTRGMAERTPGTCVNADHRCVANSAASEPATSGGNTTAQFEFPLLRRKTCGYSFERVCSPVASGLGCLPSLGVPAPRTSPGVKGFGVAESLVTCWGCRELAFFTPASTRRKNFLPPPLRRDAESVSLDVP